MGCVVVVGFWVGGGLVVMLNLMFSVLCIGGMLVMMLCVGVILFGSVYLMVLYIGKIVR